MVPVIPLQAVLRADPQVTFISLAQGKNIVGGQPVAGSEMVENIFLCKTLAAGRAKKAEPDKTLLQEGSHADKSIEYPCRGNGQSAMAVGNGQWAIDADEFLHFSTVREN